MVTFVIMFAVFGLIIFSSSAASRKARRFLALETKGLRGRGLVLSCAQLGTGVTLNGRRFEKRTMTLDVEIPGREPYVSTGDFLVPRGVAETIPGASLDVAVDARNQNQILVLGPGGFSGPWIRVGPPAPY
ncbi:MAG TPA: hypothetical protein VIK01_02615 [Polyangiaceae bacterium]